MAPARHCVRPLALGLLPLTAGRVHMPETATSDRMHKAVRAGRAATTQAGPFVFVHEEIHHVREGKHGARSTKQAIAIGLSKARRAGVKLPAPPASSAKSKARRGAESVRRTSGRGARSATRRSRATRAALKRERRTTASRQALSRQASGAARERSAASRNTAARKGARTKGARLRRAAPRRAARTRTAHRAGRRRRTAP
jgi:hypothetical protein